MAVQLSYNTDCTIVSFLFSLSSLFVFVFVLCQCCRALVQVRERLEALRSTRCSRFSFFATDLAGFSFSSDRSEALPERLLFFFHVLLSLPPIPTYNPTLF
jgi:hypothetical protein